MADLYFGIAHEGYRRDFDLSRPIGFCIYCGESDPKKLTDEHVAPEGLKGDVILYKASCYTCAKLTGYSELRVLRGPLGAVREAHHLYGKRRANERPEELPLEVLRKDWTPERIMVPVTDYPFVFRMPRFPAPHFLRAAQPDDADYFRKDDYRQFDTEDGIKRARAILAQDVGRERLLLDMSVYELSKVLAKIAYGFAIVQLGPYSIKPYVTELIIAPKDEAPSFLYYVGGAFLGNDRIEKLTTKEIGKTVVRTELVDDKTIVIVRVQLLGYLNAPVYDVVVGELMPPGGMTPLVPVPKLKSKTYKELKILSGQITANPSLASPGEPAA
jgi:hypothetical protein